MNKRSYLTIGLGVLIIVLGIAIYLVLTDVSAPAVQTVKNALPFGTGEGVNIPAADNETSGTTTPTAQEAMSKAGLVQLSNSPVAGFTSLSRNGFTIVRFVDRATGHIFDIDVATSEKTQVSNLTLLKIYQAVFNKDGSRALLLSLGENSDNVVSTLVSLTPPAASSTQDLYSASKTSFFDDLNELALGENSVYYTQSGSAYVFSSGFDTNSQKALFSLPFNSWRLAPFGNNLLIYTKASKSELGYAYQLRNGSLSKVLGPLNGLIAKESADGANILYSYQDSGNHLAVKNFKSGISSEIIPGTLAEKCVWGIKKTNFFYCGTPDFVSANEPDNWYKGLTHFSDNIWRFDASSPAADLLASPKQDFGVVIDATDLKLSTNEDYLFFINKNDLTLWALKLQ